MTGPWDFRLNYKVLKWAYSLRPVTICSIIEASVHLGIHHPRWKSALVVAVPKPGKKDYSSPCSHRPIQLIECLGKLVEKIVTKHLTFDAGKFNLLLFNQFGGRSNSLCLDAGLSLTHDIQTAHHKGLISSFLAVDIKGFFDHVHHDRMIHVLWTKGFPLELCHWVRSFLSDRSIKIRVLNWRPITSPMGHRLSLISEPGIRPISQWIGSICDWSITYCIAPLRGCINHMHCISKHSS